MILIKDFAEENVLDAQKLLLENYKEEKEMCPCLPEFEEVQAVSRMVPNGFGVAAFEEEKLVGYICCYNPWDEFNATKASGTFVPLHGHACRKENRKRIYQMMYERFAEKLVEKNVRYHGISFFAHDTVGKEALFEYGFGMRCMDEICALTSEKEMKTVGFDFLELEVKDFPLVRDLRISLNEHLTKSPCFMVSLEEDVQNWIKKVEEGDRRTFVAKKNGEIVAYLDVADEGENFVTWRDDMKSIQGAWCNSEFRGTGLFDDLLSHVSNVVKSEGNVLLGVDHESFNPTALNFWKKHFVAYTNSLTRRIDESCAE